MISSTDYIQHHLKYLTVSLFHKGASDAHLDTSFFSVLMGVIVIALMYCAARRVTVGVPVGYKTLQNYSSILPTLKSKTVSTGTILHWALSAHYLFVGVHDEFYGYSAGGYITFVRARAGLRI